MTYQFRNASILVVDDMKPMLKLVQTLLETFGFTKIHKASNATDGLQQFLDFNPDIVLLDWHMEPFDGIELARQMRTHPRSPNRFVPIIMMTGYSHQIRVEQARDVGITEFLVKPFRASDLYARLEHLVEKPRGFVELDGFFGPDRRRRKGDGVPGEERRMYSPEPKKDKPK